MKNITRKNSDDKEACLIYYDGCQIQAFSYYDDYAYTKASESLKKFKAMSVKDFKNIHPEFFL